MAPLLESSLQLKELTLSEKEIQSQLDRARSGDNMIETTLINQVNSNNHMKQEEVE
jgi:hypothetical protein